MTYFENILRSVGRVGLLVGLVFLMAIMLLTVANVITRACGGIVPGTIDLSGLFLVVVAAFAMIYAALEKGHIAVDILASRFPRRTQEILEIFNSVICLGVMVVILWATVGWLIKGAYAQKAAAFGTPYLPFQSVWVFGLLFLCLVFLLDVYKALKKR